MHDRLSLRSLARTWASLPLTQFFVRHGWIVVFPQRRGRGGLDGTYDEGFDPDRSGYTSDPDITRAGFKRALEDIDEVDAWLATRDDVDPHRMLIGGQSRGCFDAFVSAGGRGAFHEIQAPEGCDGHQIAFTQSVWAEAVDQYLAGIGG